MKTKKDSGVYTVGLVRGMVFQGEDKKLGDIIECDVNEAQIAVNTNRGKVIDGENYSKEDFEAEVKELRAQRAARIGKGKAA